MISDIDLLVLAYRLAVLTFSLGALVYALPIPLRGVKRWAPRLISDSILAVILIVAFDTLLALADRVAQLAGGSWQYFEAWLSGGAAEFLAIKGLRVTVEALPDPIGVTDALLALLRPLDKLATTALYFLAFVGGLGLIVYSYGRLLAALGIALMAVPFRIARAAGAWLLSFVIVFTAGLQALPVFVQAVSNPPTGSFFTNISVNGIALAELNVTGWTGPLEGELHVTDYSTGEQYAIYQVIGGRAQDDNGVSIVTIPSRPSLVYSLHYEGVILYLAPYPANRSNYTIGGGVWRLNLWSPHTVKAMGGLLVYTNGSVVSVSDDGAHLEAQVHLPQDGYVEVRYADQCDVSVYAPGLSRAEGEWGWRGVHGYLVTLYAPADGEYEVNVDYNCGRVSFDMKTESYASRTEAALSYFNINFLEAYINYWFTLPFLYIAILGSASAGLARLIGGRERLPIKLF